MFAPAATAYPLQREESTICVWRFGDDVDTIYTCTHTANATNQWIAEQIETIVYNGEQGDLEMTYESCAH